MQQDTTNLLWSSTDTLQEDICNLPLFASSLIDQCPQLQEIHAFGNDSGQPLIDAFSHEFGLLQHLMCFIHVRRNIKDKLNDCNAKQVLDDIFGRRLGTVYEGLFDSSDSDDLQFKLESLLLKWRNLETSSSANMEGFLFLSKGCDMQHNAAPYQGRMWACKSSRDFHH